jgi:hypothetical protein
VTFSVKPNFRLCSAFSNFIQPVADSLKVPESAGWLLNWSDNAPGTSVFESEGGTMKADMLKTTVAVDRLATSDEIRTALLPFPDPIEECSKELLHEIAADLGGYVRIPARELEASLLLEDWTREQKTWDN